jgi:hypothetical protein
LIRMSESHIGITNGAETSTIVPCVCSICVLPLSLAASQTRCSLPPQIKSSERQVTRNLRPCTLSTKILHCKPGTRNPKA